MSYAMRVPLAALAAVILVATGCAETANEPREDRHTFDPTPLHAESYLDSEDDAVSECETLDDGRLRCTMSDGFGTSCEFLFEADGSLIEETCEGLWGTYTCIAGEDAVSCEFALADGVSCSESYDAETWIVVETDCPWNDESNDCDSVGDDCDETNSVGEDWDESTSVGEDCDESDSGVITCTFTSDWGTCTSVWDPNTNRFTETCEFADGSGYTCESTDEYQRCTYWDENGSCSDFYDFNTGEYETDCDNGWGENDWGDENGCGNDWGDDDGCDDDWGDNDWNDGGFDCTDDDSGSTVCTFTDGDYTCTETYDADTEVSSIECLDGNNYGFSCTYEPDGFHCTYTDEDGTCTEAMDYTTGDYQSDCPWAESDQWWESDLNCEEDDDGATECHYTQGPYTCETYTSEDYSMYRESCYDDDGYGFSCEWTEEYYTCEWTDEDGTCAETFNFVTGEYSWDCD